MGRLYNHLSEKLHVKEQLLSLLCKFETIWRSYRNRTFPSFFVVYSIARVQCWIQSFLLRNGYCKYIYNKLPNLLIGNINYTDLCFNRKKYIANKERRYTRGKVCFLQSEKKSVYLSYKKGFTLSDNPLLVLSGSGRSPKLDETLID